MFVKIRVPTTHPVGTMELVFAPLRSCSTPEATVEGRELRGCAWGLVLLRQTSML